MDNVGLKRGVLEFMDYREDYSKIFEDKEYTESNVEGEIYTVKK